MPAEHDEKKRLRSARPVLLGVYPPSKKKIETPKNARARAATIVTPRDSRGKTFVKSKHNHFSKKVCHVPQRKI